MHFVRICHLATIIIALIGCSISDEFANEETRWAVMREFVDPIIISGRESERQRRSPLLAKNVGLETDEILVISIGNWTLRTVRNDHLIFSPQFKIQWVQSGDHSSRQNFRLSKDPSSCDVRQGQIVNENRSIVILTMCSDEFYVMMFIDDRVFYVRPTDTGRHVLEQLRTDFFDDEERNFKRSLANQNSVIANFKNNNYPNFHEKNSNSLQKMLEKSRDHVFSGLGENDSDSPDNFSNFRRKDRRKMTRTKRGLGGCVKGFYNLTGDTFELEGVTRPIIVEDLSQESTNDHDGADNDDSGDGERDKTNRDTGDESAVKKDGDNVGYFYDRTWEKTKLPKRKNFGKTLPTRWLELGIAIDYSVIDFHGSRVQQYVLALLNIVSAIYKDPSLDSNLRLVIVRMIFYSEKSDGMVRQGNAKKSLENVNKWNKKLLSSADENHDVAVWLTRLDIGGPSGYAPVSGACDPARSCALNRDEGLTSAFIIAHEVAHILGLTHDGDESAGNNCGEEAAMGSIMAPMVAATFHRFHWSSCSRKEFHRRAKHFKCLENEPSDGNSTHLGREIPKQTFTMDEQCRMEFGEGYALCRSFELPGPCSHLWCGHASVSQVCKTKKGPPLEGTVCGENKWCINGYCESVDRKRPGLGTVVDNARDGGWSSWSSWGKCSSSCGVGVRFRFRQCSEPTPAHGGKDCEGSGEDMAICEQANCSVRVDPRQLQCQKLPILVGLEETSPKFSMTWLAHEAEQFHLKCRISCRSAETGEIFVSQESLIDGTPCSYDSTDICVRGTCRQMGCDKVLNSGMKFDSCGVCNGNDATCSKHVTKFTRKIRRGMTRVAIIPRGSYNVSVNMTVAAKKSLHENLTLTVRDSRRRRNDLNDFDSAGNGQTIIVEGTAFRSRRFGDGYEVWTRGPLLAEIIVSLGVPELSVKNGLTISATFRYVRNRNDLTKKLKHSWISGGWSPCSVSCGGGTRHKTVACKDNEIGKLVNRRKCSLLLKPLQQVEKCNNFSCQYKWIPGPWEECTATCGTQGIQLRQMYCVHSSFADENVTNDNEIQVYRTMVTPIRCKGDRQPETKRDCNRTPCPGNWMFSEWSSCTRSCGKGIKARLARCVPSDDDDEPYECPESSSPDHELRSCHRPGRTNSGCDYQCRRDKSKYCVLKTLKRYCRVPGFRNRCCRSCYQQPQR